MYQPLILTIYQHSLGGFKETQQSQACTVMTKNPLCKTCGWVMVGSSGWYWVMGFQFTGVILLET